MNDPGMILQRFRQHYAVAVRKHETMTNWGEASEILHIAMAKIGHAEGTPDPRQRPAEVGRRLAQLGAVCLRVISELNLPVQEPSPDAPPSTPASPDSTSPSDTPVSTPPTEPPATVKGHPPTDMLSPATDKAPTHPEPKAAYRLHRYTDAPLIHPPRPELLRPPAPSKHTTICPR